MVRRFNIEIWQDEGEHRRFSLEGSRLRHRYRQTVFHLVGLSKEGNVVIKKRFSHKQLLTYTQ